MVVLASKSSSSACPSEAGRAIHDSAGPSHFPTRGNVIALGQLWYQIPCGFKASTKGIPSEGRSPSHFTVQFNLADDCHSDNDHQAMIAAIMNASVFGREV